MRLAVGLLIVLLTTAPLWAAEPITFRLAESASGQTNLDNIRATFPGDARTRANHILDRLGWDHIHGDKVDMFFGGLGDSQYLRIQAPEGGYFWAKQIDDRFHLSERPILEITWAVEKFTEAGLTYWDTWDRPVVVFVNFGKRGAFSPPKSIGFIWGNANDEIRPIPECLPENAKKRGREKCFRFHDKVRYFVINSGGAAQVRRNRIDLLDYHARAFPDTNVHEAKVYGVSIEAKAKSGGQSIARVYDITLAPR